MWNLFARNSFAQRRWFLFKWTRQRVRYPLHQPFPRCLTFLTPVPLLRAVWPSTRSSTARRNNLYHSFKPVLRVKSHNSLPRTLPLFLPYTCKIHVYLECFRSNFHSFSQETFQKFVWRLQWLQFAKLFKKKKK